MRKPLYTCIGVALIALFFGFLWGHSISAPVSQSTVAGNAVLTRSTASLMIDYGDGRVKTYPDLAVVGSEDLLTLLQKQTTIAKLKFEVKDYGEMGKLVTTIGNKTGGDEGKYWQFWVNNASISYAADKYIVKPGDVIEWKFINYKN